MKKFKAISRCTLLLSFLTLLASTQKPVQANTPQAISAKVTNFYRWYVGEMKRDKTPEVNHAMIRKYTSKRLYRWLNSAAYREYGADYFIAAQDFDNDWDKTQISQLKITGKTATLLATLGAPKPNNTGIGQHKLRLKLVKEAGAWKIDHVNN